MRGAAGSGLLLLTSHLGAFCSALFQAVHSDSQCDNSKLCVTYNEQPFSIWFCLLLLLAIALCCVILLCLQWCLQKRRTFSARRTLTVVALNDSDAVYVTEASQCPYSGTQLQPQNLEPAYASPAMCLSALRAAAPPSYEDIFNISKF
ncbi:transmembrane protein 207 isoform X2 [Rhinatrema bivittatum]|uniref:transmembrane protein 207 isoform X2 n=1 Tax=Rhinatrema bivittatum TaxID=194408 RepID=UPI0011270771|nr:transmembrane protein 207 isoform X2 [Rhinatrema bivittatum]